MDILDMYRNMKELYEKINMALLVGKPVESIGEDLTLLRQRCQELNEISPRFGFAANGSDGELLSSIKEWENRILER